MHTIISESNKLDIAELLSLISCDKYIIHISSACSEVVSDYCNTVLFVDDHTEFLELLVDYLDDLPSRYTRVWYESFSDTSCLIHISVNYDRNYKYGRHCQIFGVDKTQQESLRQSIKNMTNNKGILLDEEEADK
jgi:hypothetical protein